MTENLQDTLGHLRYCISMGMYFEINEHDSKELLAYIEELESRVEATAMVANGN